MTEDAKPLQPVTVSREELYRQVWETPMSRLAKQYGISGNGLAKICDRLKVPYPPRGYWAKKAAGKKVTTYRLPPVEGVAQRVVIHPSPPPAELPAVVQAATESIRATATYAQVPEQLSKPHPIIAKWLSEHDRKKREARHERDPLRKRAMDPGELTNSDHRQHRILDTLFKLLEKHGGKVKEGEYRQLSVEVEGEQIEFQLREKQKQVKRPLNEQEKRWGFYADKGWRQELEPTGKLVFAIKTYVPGGLKREWTESDTKPMETLLPDVAATLVAAGPMLAEWRRQRKEAERQRRLAEQRRHEEEQRRKLDDNRWRRFVELARQHRDVETARTFLDALKTTNIVPDQDAAGQSMAQWLAWAEQKLLESDPINHGASVVFGSIGKVTAWSYED